MSNQTTSSEGKDIAPLEHDWQRWASLMLAHFMEWDLDAIVDGTETAPDEDASSEVKLAFLKPQKKAAGFISCKLSAENRALVINSTNIKDPKAIWDALVKLYASTKARNRA